MKIERPLSTVREDDYNGKIKAADVRELKSKYHQNGVRKALNLTVEISTKEGTAVLAISPTLTWSPKGKLVRILKDLGALPEPGAELDLDELVNLPVTVRVENVERDGVTYSNITRMVRGHQAGGTAEQ